MMESRSFTLLCSLCSVRVHFLRSVLSSLFVVPVRTRTVQTSNAELNRERSTSNRTLKVNTNREARTQKRERSHLRRGTVVRFGGAGRYSSVTLLTMATG